MENKQERIHLELIESQKNEIRQLREENEKLKEQLALTVDMTNINSVTLKQTQDEYLSMIKEARKALKECQELKRQLLAQSAPLILRMKEAVDNIVGEDSPRNFFDT